MPDQLVVVPSEAVQSLALRAELQAVPRTTCACEMCVSACKSCPGCLAPGDLSAIVALVQPSNTERFIMENFAASQGATVIVRGEHGARQINTIVPKQRVDGRCVFLDGEDRCKIHAAAPFGCRAFNVCAESPEALQEDKRRVSLYLQAILVDSEYPRIRDWLKRSGHTARPLETRKAELQRRLDDIEHGTKHDDSDAAAEPGRPAPALPYQES